MSERQESGKSPAPTLIDPLVARILEANSRGLAHTTNTLIDNLTHQAETAEATIRAIREEVELLLSGSYMPTPAAILKALWPSEEFIDHHRKGGVS